MAAVQSQQGFLAQHYQHEHRSPPVPLVAILTPNPSSGHYHKAVSEYFLHSLKPPLVSLSCNEPVEHFVPRAFGAAGEPKHPHQESSGAEPTLGILKSEWLTKHRQRRPAAALVVVGRQELQGDPSTWSRMLFTLKFIRDAVAARGAGMVVAVTQGPGAGDLPADRVTSVSHNLSLDPRLVVPLVVELPASPDEAARAERDASLKSLGLLLSDQCAAYYARRAKHIADKHAQRQAAQPTGKCPPELNARMAIKLAVYAEFRQDWRTAVNEYQTAYVHVRSIIAPFAPAHPRLLPPLHASHSMTEVAASGGPASGPSLPGTPTRSPLAQGAIGSMSASMHRSSAASLSSSPLQSTGSGRFLPEGSAASASGAPGVRPRPGHHAHHASWGGGSGSDLGSMLGLGAGSSAGPPFLQEGPTSQRSVNTPGPDSGTDSATEQQQQQQMRPPLPLQLFFQAARVAELLQLKLLILLAYRERLEEAVAQANAHIQLFTKPPITLPPAAAVAHAGYLARQLQVAAEVLAPKLEASGAGLALAAAAKECSRASLMTSAALVAVQRRHLLEQLAATRPGTPELNTAAVKKGQFVGTVALKTEAGTRDLTEEEFLLWLQAEELRAGGVSGVPSSAPGAVQQAGLWSAPTPPVDAINAALTVLRDQHMERQRTRLGLLLAEEYLATGSLSTARKLLLQVAATYRRDGWRLPLAHVLAHLREVAARLRLPAEHVAYTLELAVLLGASSAADHTVLAPLLAGRLQVSAGGESLAAAAEQLSTACVASLLSGHHEIGHLPAIIKQHSRGSASGAPYSPLTTGSSTTTSAPRTFNFTVEYLDLSAAAAARRSTSGAAGAGVAGRASMDHQPHSQQDGRPSGLGDLLQKHNQQDFGLSRVLGCAVSFASPAGEPGANTSQLQLYAGLCCLLPTSLPISGVDVTLADELASQWTVPLLEWPLPPNTVPYQPPPNTPAPPPVLSPRSQPDTPGQQGRPPTSPRASGAQVNGVPQIAGSEAAGQQAESVAGLTQGLQGITLHPAGPQSPLQFPVGPLQPLDVDLQPSIWTPFAACIAPR